MSVRYRLGIDLGTNSLGWAMVELDPANNPVRIYRLGSRIFSDGRVPKTGESLAATRTKARGLRLRRKRFLARRAKLLAKLASLGLFPEEHDTIARRNLTTLDPYALRAKAVTEKIPPWHLGRALLHLAKRRGFKSNRLAGDDDEAKTTGFGIARLESELGSAKLGQLLHQRLDAERQQSAADPKYYKRSGVRFRPDQHKSKNEKFPFYPTRQMYADEFASIRSTQAPHLSITTADWDSIRDLIFDQLPLRPQVRGGCRFLKDAAGKPLPRCRLALPSFQEFRILSDACHLRYRNSPLDPVQNLDADQRTKVLEILRSQGEVKFSSLRTKLHLPDESRFTIESGKREKLEGDKVGKLLSGKNLFGSSWHTLPLAERDAIVTKLIETEQADQLRTHAESAWHLSPEAAQALADLSAKKFPVGFAPFSQEFLHHIVPELEAGVARPEGITYTEAVISLSKKLSFVDPFVPSDGSAPELPYYGQAMIESCVRVPNSPVAEEREYGRFPNPTVHIALNQLRNVINKLIRTYGKPTQISIEITRDLKLSREARRELEERQTQNQRANEARDRRINEIAKENGLQLATDYDNRLRLRLWEEQQDGAAHFCPYTGRTIPLKILFSDQIEVDHILPFALTHDDSPANKVLCFRDANRVKRKRPPHEAFGTSADWPRIEQLAALLPPNKLWRFAPDAMAKFNTEEFSGKQLHDTRHLSKAARRYLTAICPGGDVNVYPGRLTALLRHHWGLETILAPENDPDRIGKNRADHRHHSIDALVVALADRTALQRITFANQINNLQGIIIPAPWPMVRDLADRGAVIAAKNAFRAEVAAAVGKISVSHRPDHNPAGSLHEDNAYGRVRSERRRPHQLWEIEKGFNLVRRKSVEGLSPADVANVRDPHLRTQLMRHLGTVDPKDKKAWALALQTFSIATGVRSIRVLIKDKSARPITRYDSLNGRPHEKLLIPGEIHHIVFWLLPDRRTIHAEAVPVFDAGNPKLVEKRPHPAARKLFSVHKGDALRTLHKGELKLARVTKLQPSDDNRNLVCVDHICANAGDRKNTFTIQFSLLLERQTRPVYVDPIGGVRDPGPLKVT